MESSSTAGGVGGSRRDVLEKVLRVRELGGVCDFRWVAMAQDDAASTNRGRDSHSPARTAAQICRMLPPQVQRVCCALFAASSARSQLDGQERLISTSKTAFRTNIQRAFRCSPDSPFDSSVHSLAVVHVMPRSAIPVSATRGTSLPLQTVPTTRTRTSIPTDNSPYGASKGAFCSFQLDIAISTTIHGNELQFWLRCMSICTP